MAVLLSLCVGLVSSCLVSSIQASSSVILTISKHHLTSTLSLLLALSQALLLATGGGLVDAKQGQPITYSVSRADKANTKGVLAFRAGMELEVAMLLTLCGKDLV